MKKKLILVVGFYRDFDRWVRMEFKDIVAANKTRGEFETNDYIIKFAGTQADNLHGYETPYVRFCTPVSAMKSEWVEKINDQIEYMEMAYGDSK